MEKLCHAFYNSSVESEFFSSEIFVIVVKSSVQVNLSIHSANTMLSFGVKLSSEQYGISGKVILYPFFHFQSFVQTVIPYGSSLILRSPRYQWIPPNDITLVYVESVCNGERRNGEEVVTYLIGVVITFLFRKNSPCSFNAKRDQIIRATPFVHSLTRSPSLFK